MSYCLGAAKVVIIVLFCLGAHCLCAIPLSGSPVCIVVPATLVCDEVPPDDVISGSCHWIFVSR